LNLQELVKYYQINKIEIEPDGVSENEKEDSSRWQSSANNRGCDEERSEADDRGIEIRDAQNGRRDTRNYQSYIKENYSVRKRGQEAQKVKRKRRKVKWIVHRVNNVFGCLVEVFERLLGLIAKL